MRNERGEGILSGLIAAAILGVVVLIVATLYQVSSSAMLRSSLLREADNLQDRIVQIVSQRELCEAAIGGRPWTGTVAQDIAVRENGSVIAQAGMVLKNQLTISTVRIRPRDVNRNNIVDDPNTPVPMNVIGPTGLPVLHRTFAGEIVIQFAPIADVGGIQPRVIPVLVTVDAANVIRFCDMNDESTQPPLAGDTTTCTPARAIREGEPAGQCTIPTRPTGCSVHAYVAYVDSAGEPKCRCKLSCPKPVWYNYTWSGLCAPANAVRNCPAGAESIPPYVECPQHQGQTCFIPVAGAPCVAPYPMRVFRMVCN